jgi:cell division protein WhiA
VILGRLAEDVRAELAALVPARRCDRLAEVSGLLHTAGSVHLKGRGELAFHLDLLSSPIARHAFGLLRSLRVESEIRRYRRQAFDRATRFQLHVVGTADVRGVIAEAGVLDRDGALLDRPPGHVVARACCRGAYLRGAFLGGGSLSGPRSPHLELRTPQHAGASFLRTVAHAEGVRVAIVDRPSHSVAYVKSWESIATLLASMGATEAVLGLEERAVVADLRAAANRLGNADHANLVRQSRSAQEQIEAVLAVRAAGILARAPEPLQEAARLRLKHPTLSLRDLAGRADPPVTKATMQRRLARIVELATR